MFHCLRWLCVVVVLGGTQECFADSRRCERIVSFAPSITEVLFELGLGSSVIGVSRYDRFPPAVKTLPQIGGLFDPHLEGVLALKPSLVLVLPEFGDRVGYAQGLGLDIAVVDHRSVEGILESIVAVGRFCGIESRAEALANGLRARMETVERRFFAARRVRTLVVVGGGNEGQVLKSVFVSGKDGMYNDLVRIAGGENVVTGNTASIPTVSAEGLLALNPEVIIQVRDEVESRSVTSEDIKAAWGEMSLVAAVRRGHLYVESADFMTVPGPRFIEALERFAAILESVRSGDSPHDH
ncbi:MAG: hypothetical protein RL417_456 [Pseudomonadota bacterium]